MEKQVAAGLIKKNNFRKQIAQESGFDAKGRLEPGIRYMVGFGTAGEVKI